MSMKITIIKKDTSLHLQAAKGKSLSKAKNSGAQAQQFGSPQEPQNMLKS